VADPDGSAVFFGVPEEEPVESALSPVWAGDGNRCLPPPAGMEVSVVSSQLSEEAPGPEDLDSHFKVPVKEVEAPVPGPGGCSSFTARSTTRVASVSE
jgi:hypothetical protein